MARLSSSDIKGSCLLEPSLMTLLWGSFIYVEENSSASAHKSEIRAFIRGEVSWTAKERGTFSFSSSLPAPHVCGSFTCKSTPPGLEAVADLITSDRHNNQSALGSRRQCLTTKPPFFVWKTAIITEKASRSLINPGTCSGVTQFRGKKQMMNQFSV